MCEEEVELRLHGTGQSLYRGDALADAFRSIRSPAENGVICTISSKKTAKFSDLEGGKLQTLFCPAGWVLPTHHLVDQGHLFR